MTSKQPSPRQILQKYWSYENFRPLQEEIVTDILDGKAVIGLLPTGAGKSICYQVPGIIRAGLTLVISPLVALMEDQVNQLKKRGIRAIFLHSGMHRRELDLELDNAIYGNYDFLYISPERIHSEFFQARAERMNIALIAIDEAHCISQWGHDFRPSYLKISTLVDHFPDVPFVAFTATATKDTLKDIQEFLPLKKAKLFRQSFVKKNLTYSVLRTTDKMKELEYILHRIAGAGIIYARNRRLTEELAQQLGRQGHRVDFYHAGLSYETRRKKQMSWIDDPSGIIVSTNAFGMGVDKADVRWVIHVDIPSSLEEYYQEAGRAGRDGEPAFAILLHDDKDAENAYKQLELSQVNHLTINKVYDQLNRFLMIPMGSGEDQWYNFDINLFSKSVDISVYQVQAVVKILEEAGLIATTDSFYKPSTLVFDESKERLFRSHSNSTFQDFLAIVVRNYEGLFSNPVKVSEEKIARLAQLSVAQVTDYLIKINELEMGEYVPRTDLPQMMFLFPRMEARSLDIDYARINKQYEIKWAKLEAMINYLDDDICRETAILQYFDERAARKCGHCDICKGSANSDFTVAELKDLNDYLHQKVHDVVEISDVLHWWPFNKRRKILEMLAVLENERKITIRHNQLEVNK